MAWANYAIVDAPVIHCGWSSGTNRCATGQDVGLTVITIAGLDDKLGYGKSLGADAYINYETTNDMSAAIHKAASNGIDIYWNNVGGELLDIASPS